MHLPTAETPCPIVEPHEFIKLKCSIAFFPVIQVFEDGDVVILLPNSLLSLVNDIPIQRITFSDMYELSLFKIKNKFIEAFLTVEEVKDIGELSHYYKSLVV
jgi:hypothetical protein